MKARENPFPRRAEIGHPSFPSMKPYPVLALFAAAFLPASIATAQFPSVSGNPNLGRIEVNGIAAKVNGRVITKNQVSFMLAPIYAQLAAQYPRRGPQFEKEFKQAKEHVIQELVDRQIILDEFKQIGASIKPQFVDQEVKRQIRELFNGSEEKFREELKRSRMTMTGYREMTREKMVVQAMRAEQFSDAPPPLPNEVREEYNRMKLEMRDTSKDRITFRKIFIPATDSDNPLSTPDTQLALAEDIASRISKGESFETLAKEFSKDAFADKGGRQDDVPRTDLSPEFASIIFDAEKGKTVGPLMDPVGFTIVEVISIKYGPAPPLSKVRDAIEAQVRKKKTSAQYERWIESRRKRAMIDIKI